MATLATLAACSQPLPLSFQLIDEQSHVSTGVMRPVDGSMEVVIGGKAFTGFYIVATATSVSTWDQPFFKRWGPPQHAMTTISSNAAKAVLLGEDKTRITCDFLFQGSRAIGECKSAGGHSYQFMTGVE